MTSPSGNKVLSRSLLDVATYENQERKQRNRRNGVTMTLDRPRDKAGDKIAGTAGRASLIRATVSRYPAYLTRLPAPLSPQQCSSDSAVVESPTEASPPPPSSCGRRSAGLFSKNQQQQQPRDFSPSAVKIKSKMLLASTQQILKSALFRSRSKDSVLDTTSFRGSSDALSWQHKSSVPTYVGWRPPMPLPKDCDRRPTRRPSHLSRRKFSSESDLLEAAASESGYMAITDNRLAPTRVTTGGSGGRHPSHTLPRQRIQLPDSPSPSSSWSSIPQRIHFTRLYETTRKSREQQLCSSPWYDLWTSDSASVRLCEIAQL